MSLLHYAITKVNGGISTTTVCCFSQWFTSIQSLAIALFFSFASSSNTLTHTHTSIHSHALTRIYTLTSTWAENTDRQKKKKLTPYARFQSACRPSLREASDDRMIIAVRLFVCCLYTRSLSLSFGHSIYSFARSFVRPHSATNGRNTSIACFLVCTYACTCLCL
jgi:hypothetical protein